MHKIDSLKVNDGSLSQQWTKVSLCHVSPPLPRSVLPPISHQSQPQRRSQIWCKSIPAVGAEQDGVGRGDVELRHMMGLTCDPGEPTGGGSLFLPTKSPWCLHVLLSYVLTQTHTLSLCLCQVRTHQTSQRETTPHSHSGEPLKGCASGGRYSRPWLTKKEADEHDTAHLETIQTYFAP